MFYSLQCNTMDVTKIGNSSYYSVKAYLRLCRRSLWIGFIQWRRMISFSLQQEIVQALSMLSAVADTTESERAVQALLDELQVIETTTRPHLQRAEELYHSGQDFIDNDHYAVDCIRPKCLELQALCQQYRDLLRSRQDNLRRTADLFKAMDAASAWCDRALNLLASLPLNDRPGSGDYSSMTSQLDSVLLQCPDFETEIFQSPGVSSNAKEILREVKERVADVKTKCESRRDSIRRRGHQQNKSTARVSPIKCTPLDSPAVTTPVDSGRAQHVMNELISTEESYVNDLRVVLDGYYAAMHDPTLCHLVTPQLLNGRRVLFGNLEQIWNFHYDCFLHALQKCSDNPETVGKVFLEQQGSFTMYSIYCQNKPASESLISEVGEHHPFFKECQQRLGHKLPLSAYLLKPVQRITKYKLLLQTLLANVVDSSRCNELQEAIKAMTIILDNLNEVMNAAAIIGFPGELYKQGQLLLQGSFSVVYCDKKSQSLKGQWSKFKPTQRHVFLYEHSIMLCKKREEVRRVKRATYSFKNILEMTTVGLTENARGGDKRRFELWQNQHSEVFILQAPTQEVKDTWVAQIKSLLLFQFHRIKSQSKRISQVETFPIKELALNSLNNNQDLNEVTDLKSPVRDGGSSAFMNYDWASVSSEVDTLSNTSDTSPSSSVLCVCLSDYHAASCTEISMKEGDYIEVLQEGRYGWCLGHHTISQKEGWVPASYLEIVPKRRSVVSDTSLQSFQSSVSNQSVSLMDRSSIGRCSEV